MRQRFANVFKDNDTFDDRKVERLFEYFKYCEIREMLNSAVVSKK